MSNDISLTASDVGAAASNHTHNDYVLTTDVINGQNPYGKIAKINTDGVMKVGRYLDFHSTSNSNDYDLRVDVNNGSFDVKGNIKQNGTAVSLSGHTHNYAGSSSAGGAATSANKLNTNAGNATTPVYFSNGVPVACSSSIGNTGAYISESKYNSDGSWYRKWSDGFIEQGGILVRKGSTNITLIIPFTTTNYNVVANYVDVYIASGVVICNRTTTTFGAVSSEMLSSAPSNVLWHACGK